MGTRIFKILAFGLWGLLVGEVGLSLSVVTAMSLGIVVDDTVHFLSKYLRARREQGLDSPTAVRYAFHTVGIALVVGIVLYATGAFSGAQVEPGTAPEPAGLRILSIRFPRLITALFGRREQVFPVAYTLLVAVAHPHDIARVKAALVTRLLGADAHELHAMSDDERALQRQLLTFRRWRELWDERGFMRMFQRLLHHIGAMARLLPTVGGERVLTNLRHLAELIQVLCHRQA